MGRTVQGTEHMPRIYIYIFFSLGSEPGDESLN